MLFVQNLLCDLAQIKCLHKLVYNHGKIVNICIKNGKIIVGFNDYQTNCFELIIHDIDNLEIVAQYKDERYKNDDVNEREVREDKDTDKN